MALRKLRNGPVISVDPQILRWRKQLKKKGLSFGTKLPKAQEYEQKRQEYKREDALIDQGKKKFF